MRDSVIKNLLFIFTFGFIVSVIALFAACDCSNKPVEPVEPEIKNFAIDNSFITLEVETSASLTTNAEDPNKVIWTSDDESVATVSYGYIFGIGIGRTNIKARYNEQEATCEVVVIQSSNYPYLIIREQELNIFVNGEYTLQPKVIYKSEEQASEFTYQASDNEICEIDTNGKITGKKIGSANIIISTRFNEVYLQEEIIVNVCKNIYSQVFIDDALVKTNKVQLQKNDLKEFTVKSYEEGSQIENPNYQFSYDSNQLELVKVGNHFSVRGLTNGQSFITIWFEDEGIKYSIQINVIVNKNNIVLYDTVIVDLSENVNVLSIKLPSSCVLTNDVKVLYGDRLENELTVKQVDSLQKTIKVFNNSISGARTNGQVETDDVIYSIENLVFATDLISTTTELDDFFANVYAGCGSDTSKTKDRYVILKNDIDYHGECLQDNTEFAWNDQWHGTFDGDGHSVFNLIVKHGFIAFNGGHGVIRNLGLYNVIKTTDNAGAIVCNENSGVIDNCFIQGVVRGDYNNRSGIVQSNYKTITNCIALIDYDSYGKTDGDFKAIAVNNNLTTSKIENCYAVSDTAKYSYNNTTVGLFISEKALSDAAKDLNGFNDCWMNTDTLPVFERYKVDKLDDYLCDIDLSKDYEAYKVDMSALLTYNIQSITMLDGTDLPTIINGKAFLIRKSDLTGVSLGDKFLLIQTASARFIAKICIVSKVLTAEDVNNFKAIIISNPAGYYVLGEDLTFTTPFSTILPAIAGSDSDKTAFTGVFDGRGHKMTGINISPVDLANGGTYSCATVIGLNRGTIKNVYVEMTTANSSNGIGFIGLNYGTVENVYSKVTIALDKTDGRGQVGAVVAANRTGGTISNCVGEILLGSGVTHMFGIGTVCGTNWSATLNNINRCYGISLQEVEYKTDGATVTCYNTSPSANAKAQNSAVYHTASEIADNEIFDIYKGFSKYWKIQNNELSMNPHNNQAIIVKEQLSVNVDLPKI